MERQIELQCAGKRVPMNGFTKEVVLNTLLGLLKSLKGVDAEAEITLRVGPLAK